MAAAENMQLKLLSAGAAQGIVAALAGDFLQATGYTVDGTFSAVGAIKEKFLGGARADVVVLTHAQIAELAAAGKLLGDSCADLGRVRTGVAVRSGDALPIIDSVHGLRAALSGAGEVYFPDPQKATAGIHFAKVLQALGIAEETAPRFHAHPNGATAMRELAKSRGANPIGVTQITEIRNTPGVTLVGPLPAEFELATIYAAGVACTAAAPEAARRFVALLTGEISLPRRISAGFEF
jgi:molybdate transport system substrate-binding protein